MSNWDPGLMRDLPQPGRKLQRRHTLAGWMIWRYGCDPDSIDRAAIAGACRWPPARARRRKPLPRPPTGAATAIEHLDVDLAALVEARRLTKLRHRPGIATMIESCSGRPLQGADALRERVPPEPFLGRITGLTRQDQGPSCRARRQTIAELRKACEETRVAVSRAWGEDGAPSPRSNRALENPVEVRLASIAPWRSPVIHAHLRTAPGVAARRGAPGAAPNGRPAGSWRGADAGACHRHALRRPRGRRLGPATGSCPRPRRRRPVELRVVTGSLCLCTLLMPRARRPPARLASYDRGSSSARGSPAVVRRAVPAAGGDISSTRPAVCPAGAEGGQADRGGRGRCLPDDLVAAGDLREGPRPPYRLRRQPHRRGDGAGRDAMGMRYLTITDHSPTAFYAQGLDVDRYTHSGKGRGCRRRVGPALREPSPTSWLTAA